MNETENRQERKKQKKLTKLGLWNFNKNWYVLERKGGRQWEHKIQIIATRLLSQIPDKRR